jgi:ferredoxin
MLGSLPGRSFLAIRACRSALLLESGAGRVLSCLVPIASSTVPTIRFEKEGQQVGCIEGANLRKATLDAGINPYKGLNNFNNCGGLGQCGTCVMEVLEGGRNLSPRSDVEEVYLADRPANYRLSCRTTVNGDVTVRTNPGDGVGKGSNSLVGALKALVGRS